MEKKIIILEIITDALKKSIFIMIGLTVTIYILQNGFILNKLFEFFQSQYPMRARREVLRWKGYLISWVVQESDGEQNSGFSSSDFAHVKGMKDRIEKI